MCVCMYVCATVGVLRVYVCMIVSLCVCVWWGGGGGGLTALIIKDGDPPDHIHINVRTPTQEESQVFS